MLDRKNCTEVSLGKKSVKDHVCMRHCRKKESYLMRALSHQNHGSVLLVQKSRRHFNAATQVHISGSSQGVLFQDQQHTDAVTALVTLSVFQLPAIYHADTDKH